jgi:hypothetical protein
MTPFDWLLFRRTLVVTFAALVVAFAVAAATDEASSTATMRVARLAAFAPFIAAFAVLGVCVHARSRGECRAVESLGASPLRACLGGAVAALGVGLVGMAFLASPFADANSLLPVVRINTAWLFTDGARLAHAGGVTVAHDGRIALTTSTSAALHELPGHWAALACLTPIAVLAPLWSVAALSPATRGWSMALTGIAVVTLLHLVAASRVPTLAGLGACLPLALVLSWNRARAT